MEIVAELTYSRTQMLVAADFVKETRWPGYIASGVTLAIYTLILSGLIGPGVTLLSLPVLVIAFLLWIGRLNTKLQHRFSEHPWIGKHMRFVFEGHQISVIDELGESKSLERRRLGRAFCDERGMFITAGGVRDIWIPKDAFKSPIEMKAAFESLRFVKETIRPTGADKADKSADLNLNDRPTS